MELKSNLEKQIEKLQRLAEQAENIDFSAPLIAGLNAAMAKMKYRVFNTGKDSKGIPFGKYTGKRTRVTNRKYRGLRYGDPEEERNKKKKRKRLNKNAESDQLYTEYEKYRLAHGRQVKFKDLELFGSLRRGIIIAKVSNTKAAIVIPNEKLYKIAQYQSEQITRITGQEVKIFSLSLDERELNTGTTNNLLKQLYARLLST